MMRFQLQIVLYCLDRLGQDFDLKIRIDYIELMHVIIVIYELIYNMLIVLDGSLCNMSEQ
jgi:hypothetical protein